MARPSRLAAILLLLPFVTCSPLFDQPPAIHNDDLDDPLIVEPLVNNGPNITELLVDLPQHEVRDQPPGIVVRLPETQPTQQEEAEISLPVPRLKKSPYCVQVHSSSPYEPSYEVCGQKIPVDSQAHHGPGRPDYDPLHNLAQAAISSAAYGAAHNAVYHNAPTQPVYQAPNTYNVHGPAPYSGHHAQSYPAPSYAQPAYGHTVASYGYPAMYGAPTQSYGHSGVSYGQPAYSSPVSSGYSSDRISLMPAYTSSGAKYRMDDKNMMNKPMGKSDGQNRNSSLHHTTSTSRPTVAASRSSEYSPPSMYHAHAAATQAGGHSGAAYTAPITVVGYAHLPSQASAGNYGASGGTGYGASPAYHAAAGYTAPAAHAPSGYGASPAYAPHGYGSPAGYGSGYSSYSQGHGGSGYAAAGDSSHAGLTYSSPVYAAPQAGGGYNAPHAANYGGGAYAGPAASYSGGAYPGGGYAGPYAGYAGGTAGYTGARYTGGGYAGGGYAGGGYAGGGYAGGGYARPGYGNEVSYGGGVSGYPVSAGYGHGPYSSFAVPLRITCKVEPAPYGAGGGGYEYREANEPAHQMQVHHVTSGKDPVPPHTKTQPGKGGDDSRSSEESSESKVKVGESTSPRPSSDSHSKADEGKPHTTSRPQATSLGMRSAGQKTEFPPPPFPQFGPNFY